MTTKLYVVCTARATLIAGLAFGPPALAQQQNGVTSGPAVGTAVVPSTTAQKQNPAVPAGSGQSDAGTQQGAAGVGAPGAPAKSGSEGGPSPGPGSGKRP
jgi:hypothetical protein